MEIQDIFGIFGKDLLIQHIRHLVDKSYLEEFERLTENHDKVKYVEECLDDNLLRVLELGDDFRVNKNDVKSINYRKEGNGHFSLKNKNYFEALHMYNKSICFAEKDSENLSIGYANRSAVLFELKRYKECLENIKLAKEANYPERLMNKLNKREENCLKLLETQDDDPVQHEFKLSYDCHKTIPFVANCLDMKYTKDLGRYVYTTKDLNPGDLVAIEKPFSSVLLPSTRYVRCANCLKENYLTLIPCPDCTCTMFCSKECMEEGFKVFHRYECPLIDLLHKSSEQICLIALRTCLTALSLFETIEECMEFCNNPDNENQCAFTLNYNNFTKVEHYRAIHGLVTNQDKRTVEELFQRCTIYSALIRCLFSKTPLGELLIDDRYRKFFIDLLFRHVQTASVNMHNVDLISQRNGTKDVLNFALASYAFGSLLNHSCAPNTFRIYQGTTELIFVLRPILANQPLLDSYTYSFAEQPTLIRQKYLETHYYFKCQCEACVNDYPDLSKLLEPKDVPFSITFRDLESCLSYDQEYASKNYERYFKYLKKYEKFYPCKQLAVCEVIVAMALDILANDAPLKVKISL